MFTVWRRLVPGMRWQFVGGLGMFPIPLRRPLVGAVRGQCDLAIVVCPLGQGGAVSGAVRLRQRLHVRGHPNLNLAQPLHNRLQRISAGDALICRCLNRRCRSKRRGRTDESFLL
jgi:hypothetical protein